MSKACILVVEDEPINLETLTENLQEDGYEVVAAEDGESAWQLLQDGPLRFDAVLLDRMMPDMDGIEILRRMKQEAAMQHLPVIMQTGMVSDADVAEGLEAGAYYYLTKPFAADTMLAIVRAAAQDRRDYLELQQEVQRTGRTLSCLHHAVFRFRSTEEARNIAALVANATPDPGRVALGLSELTLNAIEHGNLAITYKEKSALIENGALADEINRRLALPEYAERLAELEMSREGGEIRFVIRDQGAGFNWHDYLEMSPERAFDTHGRGIAMSRLLSFDQLAYQGSGNVVEAVVFAPVLTR